jgi:hypothetical protein
VLELDVAVEAEATEDLAEDHAGGVLKEGGGSEGLEDDEERAGRAVNSALEGLSLLAMLFYL